MSLPDAAAKAGGQERVDARRGGKVQILRLQLFEKQRLRDLALLRHLGGPGVAIGGVTDFSGVLHQHVNDLLGRLRPGVYKRLRAEEPGLSGVLAAGVTAFDDHINLIAA